MGHLIAFLLFMALIVGTIILIIKYEKDYDDD